MSVKESIGCKFLINKAGALLLRRRSDGRYGERRSQYYQENDCELGKKKAATFL